MSNGITRRLGFEPAPGGMALAGSSGIVEAFLSKQISDLEFESSYKFYDVTNTLYEYYNTNDDDDHIMYGARWMAQTFTIGTVSPNQNHNITSVKLKMYRVNNPGTLTVGIRNVDGDGKPTGGDLTSGTINANTFTTNAAGDWYEIEVTEYELQASTMYAIVCRISGNTPNGVRWKEDASAPTYAGGTMVSSLDSGVTWSVADTVDFMFEEWSLVWSEI